MRAIWNGRVIAESDDTVVVEGNHYFPAESVDASVLRPSSTHTTCPWKGLACRRTDRGKDRLLEGCHGHRVTGQATGVTPSSSSRPTIRVLISSRMGRTASTPLPAGSSSSQSRYRLPG